MPSVDEDGCTHIGCGEPIKSKKHSLCQLHYERWRRGSDMDAPRHGTTSAPLTRMKNTGPCSVSWCEEPSSSRGLCRLHYARKRDGRDMDALPRRKRANGLAETCEFDGCERPWCSRGFCYSHYEQKYIKGVELRPIKERLGIDFCLVQDCGSRHMSDGLCGKHLRRARQYGLSTGRFMEILATPVCAICAEPFDSFGIHIDHDHSCCPGKGSCGKCIRGTLCRSCNHGLGNFKDSIDRMSAAIAYLKPTEQPVPAFV